MLGQVQCINAPIPSHSSHQRLLARKPALRLHHAAPGGLRSHLERDHE